MISWPPRMRTQITIPSFNLPFNHNHWRQTWIVMNVECAFCAYRGTPLILNGRNWFYISSVCFVTDWDQINHWPLIADHTPFIKWLPFPISSDPMWCMDMRWGCFVSMAAVFKAANHRKSPGKRKKSFDFHSTFTHDAHASSIIRFVFFFNEHFFCSLFLATPYNRPGSILLSSFVFFQN